MVFRLDGYTYGDPCPNCGEHDRFGETCAAHGILSTGEEKDFKMNQLGEALIVECLECDTTLLDRLNH